MIPEHRQEDLCLVEPFKCPACTPDMLAIAVDGNRKHYRFKKSRGTDEPSLFDGLFIAQDRKVSAFVDKIRGQMTSKSGRDVCGPATFTACTETSHKSRAKVDEEGLRIAVCRHGILLQDLNHYRGEIYAYPMFLQKELAEVANATFFSRADMITVLAMQWNHRKVENLHKTLAKRFVKQELNISLEDTEQWVLEVKQWAATEKHGAQSSQEELQREIDEMIYSLRRKKHELYRQNDSNQTRQRKRRRLTELKKKLRERILQYNTIDDCTEKMYTWKCSATPISCSREKPSSSSSEAAKLPTSLQVQVTAGTYALNTVSSAKRPANSTCSLRVLPS
ncbi:hypothetical protein NQZ68_039180 [Dissostichus eleginoides]|nr:hypothetical protein NQZ68_039180 [Dissostichus eleginoides]